MILPLSEAIKNIVTIKEGKNSASLRVCGLKYEQFTKNFLVSIIQIITITA